MIGNLLQPELVELIRARDFNQLREILCEFSAPDIAEIFVDLSSKDEAVLLRILPHDLAADVFEYLSVENQEEIIYALGNEDVASILNELSPDDRTALLEELPATVTQKILSLLSPEERKIASDLLGYPKESIGRRMTPEYMAIQNSWTVGEVLEALRKKGREREVLSQLYVVDEKGRLIDFVRLRNLVVNPLNTPVSEIFENQFHALRATDDQETAIATFKKYDMTMLPVLDSHDKLVGVLTVDDVLDLLERENTEDIQKMGGMEAVDSPYLKINLLQMIKKRAGWLAILFVGEMLTQSAMAHFQAEIERAIVLVLFIPLIISSGGNSGSQATSLIIRAMALNDISLRDWWRVFSRELFAGLALGSVLAIIGFVRIILWQRLGFTNYGVHYLLVACAIACSLVGVVLFGSLAGAMLPFVLRAFKFDPAVASAPLVATLVDVTGIIIYFSIAYQILRGTLL